MAENYDNGVKWTRADILTKKDSNENLILAVDNLKKSIAENKAMLTLEQVEMLSDFQKMFEDVKTICKANLEVLNQELTTMKK